MTKKRVAVILSGCGNKDGGEIHESVSTLLALDQQGAVYQCFAPDIVQTGVVNHYTGQPADEQRNVLVESARIARGNIQPLDKFNASDFDALILPGGLGAALNLSDFGQQGAAMTVNPQVAQAVQDMHAAGKPVGALCIAPVILARLVPGAKITLGDAGTPAVAQAEKLGARHQPASHGEVVTDEANRLVSTPCYMLDASIAQVFAGANGLVKSVLAMTASPGIPA